MRSRPLALLLCFLGACLDDAGLGDAPSAADAAGPVDGGASDGQPRDGGTGDGGPASDAPLTDADAPAALPDAGTVTTAVTGILEGQGFAPLDAIANDADLVSAGFFGTATVVRLTTFPDACPRQANGAGVPNGKLLSFNLSVTDAVGVAHPATRTGVYTVFTLAPAPSSRQVQVFYERDGKSCLRASQLQATSGSVTLQAIAGRVEGTFDLRFESTERITGSFSAPRCAALDPNVTPVGGCPL